MPSTNQAAIMNGDAVIVNKCAFPVFYVSVGNTSGLVHTIPPGGMYREKFQLRYLRNNHLGFKKYSGISIKLSPNQSISTAVSKKSTFDESTVTQFEYTYDPSRAPGLWYDISNVNGYIFNDVLGWNGILPWPFEEDGLILESTSSNCPSVICPGGNPSGNSTCTQAFTHPKDNWATHGCGNNETLVLTLLEGELGVASF
ncbi:hypothetical protein BJ875DRAFT_508675 [Amylocarpus encephaloides]|uniref:Uncharacterized protein n=1 Tax=Amylocarpus encephaloides TaxID=45428 RepID=A0A9P8BYQ0_9HELO|nr:hypothetical protein BJ875DRAFT_508675 [Amylocarpus encephaloides]